MCSRKSQAEGSLGHLVAMLAALGHRLILHVVESYLAHVQRVKLCNVVMRMQCCPIP